MRKQGEDNKEEMDGGEQDDYEIDVGEMEEIIERGSDIEFFLCFPKLKTIIL